jgi:hypothetical protein
MMYHITNRWGSLEIPGYLYDTGALVNIQYLTDTFTRGPGAMYNLNGGDLITRVEIGLQLLHRL